MEMHAWELRKLKIIDSEFAELKQKQQVLETGIKSDCAELKLFKETGFSWPYRGLELPKLTPV